MSKTGYRNIAVILLAGLSALLLPATPVLAEDDETSVTAQVEVVETEDMSYGDRVANSWNTWWPAWALGKPDGWGAMVLFNGWVSTKIKDEVIGADTVVVRAANRGWWPSNLKVWVSADGRRWKPAGNTRVIGGDYQNYEFTGSFGNVKYIKIERNGGPWTWLSLDAAGVKGG